MKEVSQYFGVLVEITFLSVSSTGAIKKYEFRIVHIITSESQSVPRVYRKAGINF
jgi:hypothetical protein